MDRLDDLIRAVKEAPDDTAALAAIQAAPPEVRDAFDRLSPEALDARVLALSPPEPSLGSRLLGTAARVVPSIAGTVGGGLLGGPAGAIGGGAVGAGAGEALAEWLEGSELNPRQIGVQAVLGAIPFKGGTVAQAAKSGAVLGGGGQVATNWAADRPLTEGVLPATAMGTVVGGGAGKLATLFRRGVPAEVPAPAAAAPPATPSAVGSALREGPVQQSGLRQSPYAALAGDLSRTPAPPTRVVPRVTRTGSDVPTEIPPAAFADLFTRGQVTATATIPKPRTLAEIGDALNRALQQDQPVLPPAAVSHHTPAVTSGTGGFQATVAVKPPKKAPRTAPAAPGAPKPPTPEVPVTPEAPGAPAGVQAAEAPGSGMPVPEGARVLPGPERAPDGSLLVPPGLVEVYDRLRAQGVDSFVAQRVLRHGGVLPLAEKAAVEEGKAKLFKQLGTTDLDAATESAFDLMGQEYRAVKAFGAEASTRALGATLQGMARATKKGLTNQSGVIAPEILLATGKGLAGAAAGAATGAQVDEEDPIRGAIRGAALGGAAGLTLGSARGMSNVLIANYLGQPKTQTRNVLSTAFHMLQQPLLETPAAAGLERLIGRTPTASVGEVGPQLTALWGGLTTGWGDFWQAFRTGELSPAMAQALQKSKGATRELTDLKQWELPGGLANPMNLASRMLTAFDAWLFRAAQMQSLAGVAYTAAKQEGLQDAALWSRVAQLQANPTPELQDLADVAARRLTFKSDPSWLAEKVIGMREERPALGILIPFVRTIDSILQRGIELTPLGTARRLGATVMGQPLPQGREGSQQIARELLGTAALFPMAMLYGAGRLTGRGPEPSNESLREAWRAERKTPYSVKLPLPADLARNLGFEVSPVGEYWVPYLWLGPSAVPLSTFASATEAWEEGAQEEAEGLELIMRAASASGTALLNQHYLQDVFALGSVITDYNEAARLLQKLAVGFVPGSGFLRGYAQTDDPVVRNAQGLSDELRLLFADTADQVPPLIKADGTPLTRPDGGLGGLFSPVTPSPSTPSPLVPLFEGTGVKYPGRPDAALKVGGMEIPQTPAQKAETQMARGQGKFDLLRQQAPALEALPPERRGRTLRSLLARGSERGTRTIQQQRSEEIRATRREIRALLNPE